MPIYFENVEHSGYTVISRGAVDSSDFKNNKNVLELYMKKDRDNVITTDENEQNKSDKRESLVMYCTYYGTKVPLDQRSCPKCGMILE